MAPNIAILTNILIMVVNAKISYLNTRKSNIGFSVVNSRQIKASIDKIPIVNEMTTVELLQPSLPASLNPYNKKPNPKVENNNPGKSNLGFVVLVTSFIHMKLKIKSITPMGMTISNNNLHE